MESLRGLWPAWHSSTSLNFLPGLRGNRSHPGGCLVRRKIVGALQAIAFGVSGWGTTDQRVGKVLGDMRSWSPGLEDLLPQLQLPRRMLKVT
mmetsp:Transcript_82000/g.265677  ORF Transcript_82000/g.265677 Transcript_82000/m.265677 type:complete len:92 (+) Transcript_82000:1977-2252(+)